jgi:predicted house-cleaning noncanonical NTP pyrophosphatase (MazG superfamily)
VKLIRDEIPTLMAANGRVCIYHIAGRTEHGVYLRKKLLEEAQEAVAARTTSELLHELGDVLEVLFELATQAGCDPSEIENARSRKAFSHGGFSRGLIWHDQSAEP